MNDDQQDFDNVVWDRNDDSWAITERRLRGSSFCISLEAHIEKTFGKPADLVTPLMIGGYNIIYKMHFRDDSTNDVVIRLPVPDWIMFLEEKTLAEVGMMKYVKSKTDIPIPTIYHYGLTEQEPEIGPFLIMPFIENNGSLSRALRDPTRPPDDSHRLDPNIDQGKLDSLYGQMANYMLQLSELPFSRIGSLVSSGDGAFTVAGRPITVNMNNMLQLAGIPPIVLPAKDQIYQTADEYYIALADMHLGQLVFQHNDVVFTPDDCRNKYVARQIFRRLARKGQLSIFGFAEDKWSTQSMKLSPIITPAPTGRDQFRIWCDDLRAGNVLLDKEEKVVSFIDWEFSYVGPGQFALDPPWWLLLDQPERWKGGIEDWSEIYDMRLKSWLKAMEKAEKERGNSASASLSTAMRESWETGRFWLNYAARKSWAFDSIYWKFLDERFFGKRDENVEYDERWKTRVDLLTEDEKDAMESFVEQKMLESEFRFMPDRDEEQDRKKLAKVLLEEDTGGLEEELGQLCI